MTVTTKKNQIERQLVGVIFASRWLQAPLYIGLILAQAFYVYQFGLQLFDLFKNASEIHEHELMLIVLGLIDVVMISNLLIMVIIGGYETFVSRLSIDNHPDVPEWLSHVNANTMKIKLALSLIGISSIQLLKTFIDIDKLTDRNIMWQVIIHVIFVLSALLVAYTSNVAQKVTAHD